jgi:diacylglycerol kinase family enzyme
MRVAVVFNARSGLGSSSRPVEDRCGELIAMFDAAGVEATVCPVGGNSSLAQDIRDAMRSGVDAVVAAGGDGTVNAVASAVAGTDVALGVLPLGTLNHFARDVGIPQRVSEAIAVIAAGRTRAVDIAEVNGRCFVNNSSIGLYPHLVSKRDRQRERLGYGKWLAMLAAVLSLFRRYPVVSVLLETPQNRLTRTSPFLFVGNNRYVIDGLSIGMRQQLDRGELSLYFGNRTGRFGLLRMAIRALFGRLEQAEDFDSLTAPAVRIQTRKKTLKVSLDGEVVRLAPPLLYHIRPGALRVLVP